MSELIDRSVLKARMYSEAFESDTDMQKWDSGCWIRYKLFEKVVDNMPTVPYSTRWHRVEDDMPPKGFALIGARKRPPEISEDVWDMWVCEYDGEWGWQDMDGYALRGITHWMPIEPPKEDA